CARFRRRFGRESPPYRSRRRRGAGVDSAGACRDRPLVTRRQRLTCRVHLRRATTVRLKLASTRRRSIASGGPAAPEAPEGNVGGGASGDEARSGGKTPSEVANCDI